MAKKIYKKGNYIFIEDTVSNVVIEGAAKDVKISTLNTTSTKFYIKGTNADSALSDGIELADFVDENDVAFASRTAFVDWYTDNTSFSNGGGNGNGVTQNLQQVTDEGATTNDNITTQAMTSTGSRANGDLVVTIGDYDDTDTGAKFILNQGDESAVFETALGVTVARLNVLSNNNGVISSTDLTSEREFRLPNTSGTPIMTINGNTPDSTGAIMLNSVTQSELDTVENDLQTQINGLASANPNDVFYARRTEFLDEGINLYNKNDDANDNSGWLNNGNVPQTHVSATYTKYFTLKPNQDYWYLNAYGASTSLCIVDENYDFVRAITGTVNNTFTAAASGEAYVRFSVRDKDTFLFAEGDTVGTYEPYIFRIKPEVVDDNPYKDKSGVVFGDSITWFTNGWVKKFIEDVNPQQCLNFGESGQKIAWRVGTVETSNPTVGSGHDDNVFWNSISKWEASASHSDPDFIIIALGTNDISQGSTLGSMADAYSLDVNTITQLTMANAYRKAVYRLQTTYPNAQIFYCTPLQSKTGGRNWTTINNVRTILTEISERMNVKVIDTTMLSGISEEYENASAAGRYYYDGTHPTHEGSPAGAEVGVEYGSTLQGRCVAAEFKKLYYLP